MSKQQTDNSFFMDKVYLRLNNLPSKDKINVLDMFGGEGRVWESVSRMSEKHLNITRIDQKKLEGEIYLKGDNVKFLKTISLQEFDVIDLDAYGIPYKQLKIIFERSDEIKPETAVFVTFIQANKGTLPKRFLYELGYTRAMVKKCPTLFCKSAFEKFKNYLAPKGIKEIRHRSHERKHYIYFKIN